MPITAVIDSAIPQQNFEVIGLQIAGVLMAEFLNQKTNFDLDPKYCPTSVGQERYAGIDEEDFPVMTVSLHTGDFAPNAKDYSGNTEATYLYDIDVYTGSPSTLSTGGDQLAVLAMQRILGIARAILEDNRYCTLGLPTSAGIRNVHVAKIISENPYKMGNTADFVCGRLILSVDAPETTAQPSTVAAVLGPTTVHLTGTNGIFYWGAIEP